MKFLQKLKGSKTAEYIFLGVISVAVIAVLAVSFTGTPKTEAYDGDETIAYVKDLENRLEKTLSAVNGAGNVSVVITVESGKENTAEALEAVRVVVEPLLAENADQLVLGCTHYPFLTRAIRQVIGDRDVKTVNSAPAIVRRVRNLLSQGELEASLSNVPEYTFMSSAGQDYLSRLREKAETAVNMEF